MFEDKFDHIFEDIQFPSMSTPSDMTRQRQDAVQHLRKNYKFIYVKDDQGKFVRPFSSGYILRSLHYLLFGKKPRFGKLLQAGENLNNHAIAVVCTFVSIFY